MGTPNPAKRGGLCVLTGFGADLTSLHVTTISLTSISTYIAALNRQQFPHALLGHILAAPLADDFAA